MSVITNILRLNTTPRTKVVLVSDKISVKVRIAEKRSDH